MKINRWTREQEMHWIHALKIFSYAYLPTVYTFQCMYSVHVLCPLSNWSVHLFSFLSFESSLCILDTSLLSDMWFANISPSIFVLFTGSFSEQKVFILNDPVYLFFFFYGPCFWCLSLRSLHPGLDPGDFLLFVFLKVLLCYILHPILNPFWVHFCVSCDV